MCCTAFRTHRGPFGFTPFLLGFRRLDAEKTDSLQETENIFLPASGRLKRHWINAVSVPIIGMGGIANADDAIEFILAGATAVSVGTANFFNPNTTMEVVKGIEDYMIRHNVSDINELIGLVK